MKTKVNEVPLVGPKGRKELIEKINELFENINQRQSNQQASENEYVVARALNDLNSRIQTLETAKSLILSGVSDGIYSINESAKVINIHPNTFTNIRNTFNVGKTVLIKSATNQFYQVVGIHATEYKATVVGPCEESPYFCFYKVELD